MGGWFMLLPGLFIALLLAVIGYAVKYRKAYWLISGYNTMPAEKKKNVDAEGLGRFMGNCLFAGSALMAATFAFFALGVTAGGFAMLGLLVPGIVFMVVYAQKYDGNAKKADGGWTARTKLTIALLVVVLGGAAAGVAVLLNASSQSARYTLSDGNLEIKCVFGESVALKDILGLETVEDRPDISTRTWGSAVGEKLRGSFALSDGRAAKIFVETLSPPFIRFTVGSTQYYLNCSTPDETIKLYTELVDSLTQ
jgi:hypothetical protein